MNTTFDPAEPLATLDKDTGKPPTSRVISALSVRQRVSEIRDAESLRSERRTHIQGLLDGNRPVPESKMRKLNRMGDANINLRTGEATVDSAKTPYYDLIFDNSDCCIQIQLEYGLVPDSQLRSEWSQIMSEELHCTFNRWDGFDGQMQLKQWQMCVHGTGLPVFEDAVDWRWRSRPISDCLVPDDADADIDLLEELVIPRAILPTQLYDRIKNPKAAETRGWNVKATQQAIINAAPAGWRKDWGNNFEKYQDSLRCGDVMYNAKTSRIFVADYFAKEFDGKITHAILLDNQVAQKSSLDGKNKKDDFLFLKERRFDSFSQIVCPFFFDIVGAGLWHGVKGLGPKIFDFCSVENILTNNAIDKANLGIGVIPKTAVDKQSMETITAGGVTFFQPGTEFVKVSFNDNIEASLLVKRDLQSMREGNIGMYRQTANEQGALPTLGQEQIATAERAMLTKGAINRYYKSLDRLFREMVRRILKAPDMEAKMFRERCTMRGVPEQLLKFEAIYEVKATRAVGYGSPAMRGLASEKLMAGLPTITDERSRTNALRTAYAPFVGTENLDSFFPRDKAAPTNQISFAALENNALQSPAGGAMVTSDQDHIGHFDVHTQSVFQHGQAAQGGQSNPMALLTHLTNYLPHAQEHLQAIAGDESRKNEVEQRMQTLAQLAQAKDQLEQQVSEAMKAQQAQQAQGPKMSEDFMLGLAKIHADAAIKDKKVVLDAQRKAQQTAFNQRLKDLQTAGSERRANVTTVNTVRRSNLEKTAA